MNKMIQIICLIVIIVQNYLMTKSFKSLNEALLKITENTKCECKEGDK